MKKKYKVQVVRRYFTSIMIDVEAKNADEARQIAEDESGNIEGSMQLEEVETPEILEGDEDEDEDEEQ